MSDEEEGYDPTKNAPTDMRELMAAGLLLQKLENGEIEANRQTRRGMAAKIRKVLGRENLELVRSVLKVKQTVTQAMGADAVATVEEAASE